MVLIILKFRGKDLCQNLFFNKVAGLRPGKETLAQVFSCDFCEIFKNAYFYRTSPVAASNIGNLSFYTSKFGNSLVWSS